METISTFPCVIHSSEECECRGENGKLSSQFVFEGAFGVFSFLDTDGFRKHWYLQREALGARGKNRSALGQSAGGRVCSHRGRMHLHSSHWEKTLLFRIKYFVVTGPKTLEAKSLVMGISKWLVLVRAVAGSAYTPILSSSWFWAVIWQPVICLIRPRQSLAANLSGFDAHAHT